MRAGSQSLVGVSKKRTTGDSTGILRTGRRISLRSMRTVRVLIMRYLSFYCELELSAQVRNPSWKSAKKGRLDCQ